MARVSQQRRTALSELLEASDAAAPNVDCAQPIQSSGGPRQLVYRRLRGVENTFNGAWPASTSIYCWYCRLPFDGTPVPIVQQYDRVKDQYDVYGVCCSAACAKAKIIDEKTNDARNRLILFSKMMIEVFGWPRDKPILPAWPWQAIDVFGGYKTIKEWRNRNGDTSDVRMRLKKPPFVPYHIYTETERRGVAIIDDIGAVRGGGRADDDTVEQQAIQHGAPFSLKGLRRPPEDQCIKTWEQFRAKHPECATGDDNEPLFNVFLREHALPSDEKCREISAAFKQAQRTKRAERKRAKTAAQAATAAAAAATQAQAGAATALDETTGSPPSGYAPSPKPSTKRRAAPTRKPAAVDAVSAAAPAAKKKKQTSRLPAAPAAPAARGELLEF